jgi:hypothetical protein
MFCRSQLCIKLTRVKLVKKIIIIMLLILINVIKIESEINQQNQKIIYNLNIRLIFINLTKLMLNYIQYT